MLVSTQDFADEVMRLSCNVRMALVEQLNIVSRTDADLTDADLPPDAEMGEEAVEALKALCQYLDEHDPGNHYQLVGGIWEHG